ncbi:hypothetical protein LBMAG38_20800 [Chloroflexota bacterium]|nr:hypothetical protein LBMAG38_20800 [Chloroflexota bacterium]
MMAGIQGSTTRWEGADVIGSGSAVTGDLGLGPGSMVLKRFGGDGGGLIRGC